MPSYITSAQRSLSSNKQSTSSEEEEEEEEDNNDKNDAMARFKKRERHQEEQKGGSEAKTVKSGEKEARTKALRGRSAKEVYQNPVASSHSG